MIRPLLFFILLAVGRQITIAQTVLPASLRVDWSKAGYNGIIPTYSQVSINGFGTDSTSDNESDSAIILPVVLKSFNAVASGCNAMLQWLANDVAGDVYILESSSNGVSFTPIKTVDADGAANGSIYTYTLAQGDATIWYRLKMTGKNGHITYSRMAPVTIRCNKPVAFFAYPNPVSDYLTIKYDAVIASTASLWVNDAAGKTVVKKEAIVHPGKNNWLLDMQALPPGLYYVQLRNENNVVASQKVMKK